LTFSNLPIVVATRILIIYLTKNRVKLDDTFSTVAGMENVSPNFEI